MLWRMTRDRHLVDFAPMRYLRGGLAVYCTILPWEANRSLSIPARGHICHKSTHHTSLVTRRPSSGGRHRSNAQSRLVLTEAETDVGRNFALAQARQTVFVVRDNTHINQGVRIQKPSVT